jgi:kinesin family member 5
VTTAGVEGGKNLAESAQDLERTRKAISVQLAEFDGVKKSLMRDLQNRCEKVRFPSPALSPTKQATD